MEDRSTSKRFAKNSMQASFARPSIFTTDHRATEDFKNLANDIEIPCSLALGLQFLDVLCDSVSLW
jgi:hypothetical protein